MTRRTLLIGAAAGAAGASGLLSGALARAATEAQTGQPAVFSEWVGGLRRSSGVLAAARDFALVGVEWEAPADARIELRVRAPGGRWSRWGVASVLGHGPDAHEAAGSQQTLIGSPLWAGGARWVELASSRPLRGVRLHLVSAAAAAVGANAGAAGATGATGPTGATGATGAAAAAAAYPYAAPVLPAGAGQPVIIARNAWAHGHASPRYSPAYGAVRLAFVHHTDNLNGYSAGAVPEMIYAIYQFHRYTNGWNDIGYNFVIDAFGRIWEARQGGIDLPVVGAHAGGYNLESTGIAVLGTFMDAVPSAAAVSALQRLLAWKLPLHGVPVSGRVTVEVNPADAFYTPFRPGARVSLPRIAGHRQGCATDCPGSAFFGRLPALRANVAGRAGPPATLTLTAAAGEQPASYLSLASVGTSAGVAVALSGRLAAPGGAPLAGAAVELQQIAAGAGQTIATVVTDASGRWSATLTPSRSALVRALHRAAPAVASDVVALAVAPTIALAVASTAPLTLTGVVTPPVGPVTVTLYALAGASRVRRRRRKLSVDASGRFRVDFGVLPPGSYEATATTPARATNASGAATPVTIAIQPG